VRPSLWRFVGLVRHYPISRSARPARPPRSALVVALHGCTQTAHAYERGTGWSDLADRYGFVVIYPQQQPANNPKSCFSWFLPGDTVRDAGETLSIRQMIEKVVVEFGIDRDRVFVTGLSAGGAMAAVMLATYPEVFTGGTIVAGLPYGSASSVQEAFEAMFKGSAVSARALGDRVRGATRHRGPWPRISVWHGLCRSSCHTLKRRIHHCAVDECPWPAAAALRRRTGRSPYPTRLEWKKRRASDGVVFSDRDGTVPTPLPRRAVTGVQRDSPIALCVTWA
jgi:poly(hydroxyalkanoate) depolymerase family esterase